jgi:DnaK suppressor protein
MSAKKASSEASADTAPAASGKRKTADKAAPTREKGEVQKESTPRKHAPAKRAPKTAAPAVVEAGPGGTGLASETVPSDEELPPDYQPSPDEPYMNARQLAYFRRKLLEWRDALLLESQQTIDHLRSDGASRYVGDEADRARDESEVALELRTRDRYRKLLPKIEAALRRIEDGSYGYCEETGEPIGLKRLEARPIATLSVEAQELRERSQRGYRDDA